MQTNINNASRIITKELKHSKEINISDDHSNISFVNLNEGNIYLERNIIKMKKGKREENLTDKSVVVVEDLEFGVESNIVVLKIKGKFQGENQKDKNKPIKEYIMQLKIESLINNE